MKTPQPHRRPKAAKPKAAKPKAAKPKAAKPKAAKPKASKPGSAKPRPAKPKAAKPKAARSPLDEQDDAKLCDAVFCAFPENEIEVEAMGEHERVVTLVWQAYGIIGNGGFHYLFEGDFNGDPGFLHTAASFAAIGAVTPYRCFQEALGCFPGSRPHEDHDARLAHFESVPQEERDRIDHAFWDAGDEIEAKLAAWIRAHRPQLEAALRR